VRIADSTKKPKRQKASKSAPVGTNGKLQSASQEAQSPPSPAPAQPPSQVSVLKKLSEAGMRRLTLTQAMEVAGHLYDDLHEPALRSCKTDSNLSVLRELSMRRIMLDRLAHELTTRGVLPVTLNTLSNLFARACANVV
jgi:hypothetical protein